jgi:DNA-binding transcriptional MerR regulator
MKNEWTLRELATRTGVPGRTIRYYISRGLLAPPLRGGRNAFYGTDHIERLQEIRKLQSEGMTLSEIAFMTAGPSTEREMPASVAWNSYAIDDDVMVLVRRELDPWRTRKIRAALREFTARIIGSKGTSTKEEENV